MVLVGCADGCEPEPGCDGIECAEGTKTVCLNFCVEERVPVDGEEVACALDPCDTDAFSGPNVFACGDGFTCQPAIAPNDPRLGTCEPATATLGTPCGEFRLEPGGEPQVASCRDGLACIPLSCARAQAALDLTSSSPPLPVPGAPPPGVCVNLLRDGASCLLVDEEPDDGEAPACYPCAAGLFCVANGDGGPTCRRHCGTPGGLPNDDVCPCGDATRCVEDRVAFPGSGAPTPYFCEDCVPVNGGRECGEDSDCCATAVGATCETVPGADGQPRQNCCISQFTGGGGDTSVACGQGVFDGLENGGCCPGTRCDGGACVECVIEGPVRRRDLECCAGSALDDDGFCVRCVDGLCGESKLSLFDPRGRRSDYVVPEIFQDRSEYPFSGGEALIARIRGRQRLRPVDRVERLLHPFHRLYLMSGADIGTDLEGNRVLLSELGQPYLYFADAPSPPFSDSRVVDLGTTRPRPPRISVSRC